MEANGGADEVMISGSDVAECSQTTVEIKIKTLDSQTYRLRVNKCMPVPALKEQIASVTGVLSEQQRLICRGKVLKDDQLLSAYHVEDGHTLHLVVRQPLHSSSSSTAGAAGVVGSETAPDHPATDPSSNTARNRGNHVAHSVVLGTFNIADQGDGVMPDINRIVSAVLSSIGISNLGTGGEGVDLREHVLERLDRTSGATGMSASTQVPTDLSTPQAQSDPLRGALRFPSAVSVGPLQPTVIPDSLATISQYLRHMRVEFGANGRSHGNDTETLGMHGMEGRNSDAGSRSNSGQGLPTPASLAEVVLSTRQMLVEQAGECLSLLARQLEDQASVTDPLVRTMSLQSSTMRSGVFLQNLGALLLELGRTTMTLRMGRTPSEAVVNAGPAVFISTSGPNPIMVQPLPFQPGTSFGAIPTGAVQSGNGLAGGILGSGFLPRNIDIRIRTGRSMPATNANQRDQAGAQQPPGQPDPPTSAAANFVHQTVSGISGGSSFTGDSGVRVVPVRTVVAVPAALRRPPTDSAGSAVGLFYPLLARIQHLSPGQLGDARGSQPSGETHPTGPETARPPIPEPAAVHQQNLGSNGVSARGDGDSQTANCLSTNAASVASEIGASANTSTPCQQGSVLPSNSSQQEPCGNSNHNTHASDRQQNGRESMNQIPSRFDQLLRTIFSGEQINVSDINFQGTGAGSVAEQTEPTRNAEPNEASTVGLDPGLFFSGLVRQIMPFISQATATETDNTSSARVGRTLPDHSTSQAETENPSSAGNSHHRDPPSPPDSKRQKLFSLYMWSQWFSDPDC
ncbi:ubiquitin-like domain-containing protein CIP73 isoform X3 [Magnolia sinica]|uniref:ubiquitin-like domain-containing protein CIP73 isoform X3 n=1 Tax=Magnolia sinica TaxID=86752 RepID=UPI00265858CF|nr:ubiquitin-like domain-containing protein CIP73 isoform X3 [Magnolia sinica]XP_058111394.1 ubiquitin-like domain-containing protein CIP73 isoform X3 [Magnolia sinica]